jgi:hypothetical protein
LGAGIYSAFPPFENRIEDRQLLSEGNYYKKASSRALRAGANRGNEFRADDVSIP